MRGKRTAPFRSLRLETPRCYQRKQARAKFRRRRKKPSGFENTKGPKYPDCPSSGTKQRADAVALPSLSLLQNPTVPAKWMSGGRALGTDRRRRFNPSYRALREFLSEGKSPFSLDPYLSRMSPGISALRCYRLRHLNLSTLLPKSFK